jgi:hypothetical protein
VYYLLLKYGILEPYDDRFHGWLSAIDLRLKPFVSRGEKPEIEFAIGIFHKRSYLRRRDVLQDPKLLWDEVTDRFNMHEGLDMKVQSYLWDEWFSKR